MEAGNRVLASVDTRTFRVTERRAAARRSPETEAVPWLLVGPGAGAAVLLLAAVAALGGGRRGRGAAAQTSSE